MLPTSKGNTIMAPPRPPGDPVRRRHLIPAGETHRDLLSPRRVPRPRSELLGSTFASCENLRIDTHDKPRRRRISLLKNFKSEINLRKTESILDLSERGAPEGQEDPALHTSVCSGVSSVSLFKVKEQPDKVAIREWVLEKLRWQTAQWFTVFVKTGVVCESLIEQLVIPEPVEERRTHHRISLAPGEVIKKYWNIFLLAPEDVCCPSTFCVTNQALYSVDLDGRVKTRILHKEVKCIEISCNFAHIDITSLDDTKLGLLVPDQELCLTVVSFIEHSRRRLKEIDIRILKPDYALLADASYDCFVLRDTDGGGAFQLDGASETASGHLMYCRLHKEKNIKWISGYFVLRGRILQCFTSPNVPHPKWDIPLRETGMAVSLGTSSSVRPNTVELWYQEKTVLILAAATADEAQTWYNKLYRTLDALSPVAGVNDAMLAMGGMTEGAEKRSRSLAKELELLSDRAVLTRARKKTSRSLALQHRTLTVSESSVSLLSWVSQQLSVELSAKLEQISTIKLDPELDSAFAVIDFEWQEAGDDSGDWVVHFPSWSRMEDFLSSLRDLMPNTAEICYFEEGSYLLQRCRNVSQALGFTPM